MPTIFYAILIVTVAAGGSGSANVDLEIHASLRGFNLLWPRSRCCAFELHVQPDGSVTTTITVEGDPVTQTVTETSHLSPAEMDALRSVVGNAGFFTLPKHVGVMPVDGDEHVMQIRLADLSRTVTLYDWPDDRSDTPGLSERELDATRRAHAVWSAIRSLVTDPRAKVL